MRARYQLVTGATSEPVTLDEVKTWLEVTGTSHDDLIRSLIADATKQAEAVTWRSIISATYKAHFDSWCGGELKIWKTPVTGISSITYKDSSNSSQTLSTSNYFISISSENEPARIQIINAPSLYQYGYEKVTVEFVTGYSDAHNVPEGIKNAIKTYVTTKFEVRQGIITGTQVHELDEWFRRALQPYIVDYV